MGIAFSMQVRFFFIAARLPRAVLARRHRVNDGGRHEGESGAGHGAHQGDEQVQLGDDGCQSEGEEHQDQPDEILHLDVFVCGYFVLDVGVDDVHRDVELDRVTEEYCQSHHDLDKICEAERRINKMVILVTM